MLRGLGAALAHGIPTIALDGPERWQELAEADALEIVPPEEAAVAAALRQLLGSPAARRGSTRPTWDGGYGCS